MSTLDLNAPALPKPIAASLASTPPATPTTWIQVSEDLWTANTGGDFVGTVERIGDRFLAVDDHGMPLGWSGTLGLAQARLSRPPGRAAARLLAAELAEDRLAMVTAWVAGVAVIGAVTLLVLGLTP